MICLSSLHELHMTKELCDVKACLVRRAPSTELLGGERLGAGDCPEEVHPPFGALGLAGLDVEQAEGDLGHARPQGVLPVQGRGGGKAVRSRVGDEQVVKRRALGPVLGGVVDECLVRHVVGVDLILKVRLRVVGALVDEGLDDLVLPDVAVGGLVGVEEEIGLVVGGELDLNGLLVVAEANFGLGELGEIRDRLGDGRGAHRRARWHLQRGDRVGC